MIKLENVSYSYNDLAVLYNVSLEINEEEIVVIIGPSGCGKSTLLNLITKLNKTKHGTIAYKTDKIGYVFQDDRLLPWKSVYDNIKLVNKQLDEDKINKILDDVNLTKFKDYYPSQLSGGMKKRCGIARAFYYDCDVLLMDEPFQGLDYNLRNEMNELLLNIWQKSKQSILFITHEIDEALFLAHRILVMSSSPTTIIKEFKLPDHNIRANNAQEINEIKEEIIKLIK